MSVTSELNASQTARNQTEDMFKVRASLENVSNVLLETNATIQAIVDSGNFNMIPADLKAALGRWWNIFKDAQTDAEGDAEIVEIYQWRP